MCPLLQIVACHAVGARLRQIQRFRAERRLRLTAERSDGLGHGCAGISAHTARQGDETVLAAGDAGQREGKLHSRARVVHRLKQLKQFGRRFFGAEVAQGRGVGHLQALIRLGVEALKQFRHDACVSQCAEGACAVRTDRAVFRVKRLFERRHSTRVAQPPQCPRSYHCQRQLTALKHFLQLGDEPRVRHHPADGDDSLKAHVEARVL